MWVYRLVNKSVWCRDVQVDKKVLLPGYVAMGCMWQWGVCQRACRCEDVGCWGKDMQV